MRTRADNLEPEERARDSAWRTRLDGTPADLEAALRAAFRDARTRTLGDHIDIDAQSSLRAAVRAFAQRARAEGSAPEATLIALKNTIRDIAHDIVDTRPTSQHDTEQDLVTEIVAWCIDDYYCAG